MDLSNCYYCGDVILERGDRRSCKKCYDINKAYSNLRMKKYMQIRKEKSLCLRCGNPTDTKHVHCSKCKPTIQQECSKWYYNNKEYARQKQREYYLKNKDKLNKKRVEAYQKKKLESKTNLKEREIN